MWLYLLILIAFLFAAFFSGMEIALISASQLRFELEKRPYRFSSILLSFLFHHQEQFIVTTLVGNTIAIVIFTSKLAEITTPFFTFTHSDIFITLIQTLVASTFLLIFGEYLPKVISRSNPNLFLRSFSILFGLFYVILYPLVWIIIQLYKLIFGLLHISIHHKPISSFSRVDFDYLVQENINQQIEKEEIIDPEEEILQNALDFSSVKLRDCMVPRTELIAIDQQTATTEQLKQLFIDTGHSKIILYQNDIDNIVGYIHSSEMLRHPEIWKNYVNSVPIVPETMPAHHLMKLLNQMHKSLAVVVDEFGGTAGIVTLEDILEEIFGEIEDEHDKNALVMKQIDDTSYILSARLEIETVNHQLHLNLPESEIYMTLAGLILHYLQHLPKVNEVIQIESFEFRILKMGQNRIELVKLLINPSSQKN
ncbi:hemolysin family protein [Microbacter margulisiae]|uniref:CBS domain containing-hemolysin-like protein n=1 Tax=Microbacter margulisiae TaxID=1350067 RepID=A0A7W5DPL4_9PORP|nr:hemolysin family protein [Microbacter margulisiae]MBB3186413.1 CBS domain containing-hemolysin-like protein [Microbacter margulisiae]